VEKWQNLQLKNISYIDMYLHNLINEMCDWLSSQSKFLNNLDLLYNLSFGGENLFKIVFLKREPLILI
jgi:hypothetical protein